MEACKAARQPRDRWHVLARLPVCLYRAYWPGFLVRAQSPHRPTPCSSSLCLQIRGTDKSSVRELHIAYRYGEHYDSVRRINDNSEAPAHLQTDVSEALVPSAFRPVGSYSRAVSWS